jgi:hypothetical protein
MCVHDIVERTRQQSVVRASTSSVWVKYEVSLMRIRQLVIAALREAALDPSGAAHTFSLVYDGGRWKKFDNDHQAGVIPTNDPIRVIWE